MIRIKKDGRTIRTGVDYTRFRYELHAQQKGLCICGCGRMTDLLIDLASNYSAHVAHRGSRGMGGAIRDDVVGPKRGQVEGIKAGYCHRKEHGQ